MDLFTFKGRLNRLRYFGYQLLASFGMIVGLLIGWAFVDAVGKLSNGANALWVFGVFLIVGSFAVYMVAKTSIMFRRLHDLNQPGISLVFYWVGFLLAAAL